MQSANPYSPCPQIPSSQYMRTVNGHGMWHRFVKYGFTQWLLFTPLIPQGRALHSHCGTDVIKRCLIVQWMSREQKVFPCRELHGRLAGDKSKLKDHMGPVHIYHCIYIKTHKLRLNKMIYSGFSCTGTLLSLLWKVYLSIISAYCDLKSFFSLFFQTLVSSQCSGWGD